MHAIKWVVETKPSDLIQIHFFLETESYGKVNRSYQIQSFGLTNDLMVQPINQWFNNLTWLMIEPIIKTLITMNGIS